LEWQPYGVEMMAFYAVAFIAPPLAAFLIVSGTVSRFSWLFFKGLTLLFVFQSHVISCMCIVLVSLFSDNFESGVEIVC
jgi:hypothetical protein